MLMIVKQERKKNIFAIAHFRIFSEIRISKNNSSDNCLQELRAEIALAALEVGKKTFWIVNFRKYVVELKISNWIVQILTWSTTRWETTARLLDFTARGWGTQWTSQLCAGSRNDILRWSIILVRFDFHFSLSKLFVFFHPYHSFQLSLLLSLSHLHRSPLQGVHKGKISSPGVSPRASGGDENSREAGDREINLKMELMLKRILWWCYRIREIYLELEKKNKMEFDVKKQDGIDVK